MSFEEEIGNMNSALLGVKPTGDPNLDDKDKDDDKDEGKEKDKDVKDPDDKTLDDDKDKDKDDDSDKNDDDIHKDDDKLDDKDKVIEDLRRQIAEMSTKHDDTDKDIKDKDKVTKDKKDDDVKDEPIQLTEQDFIGDEDPEELIADPKKLNKLLNSIYVKAVQDARTVISEKVLLSIPNIVKKNLDIMTTLKTLSEKFYTDNSDLEAYKPVVAKVYEELSSKSPAKTIEEIMKDVGPEVRKRLNLKADAIKKEKDKDDLPTLPKKTGGRHQESKKPDTSPMQTQLEEMNKSLRR